MLFRSKKSALTKKRFLQLPNLFQRIILRKQLSSLSGKKLMKKTDKMLRQLANLCLFDKFLLLVPLVVWFSYQPNIYLGYSSAMNIELSLVLIYVAVLAVFALPLIVSNYQKLLRCNLVRIVGLFILWSFMSIIWSSNLSRAILTAGVSAALFTVLLGMLSTDIKKLTPILKNIYIASAA